MNLDLSISKDEEDGFGYVISLHSLEEDEDVFEEKKNKTILIKNIFEIL